MDKTDELLSKVRSGIQSFYTSFCLTKHSKCLTYLLVKHFEFGSIALTGRKPYVLLARYQESRKLWRLQHLKITSTCSWFISKHSLYFCCLKVLHDSRCVCVLVLRILSLLLSVPVITDVIYAFILNFCLTKSI